MIILYRSGKLFSMFLFLCFLIAAVLLVLTVRGYRFHPAMQLDSTPSLVIDPGHGGVDGGAIAFNGVKESDINLSIGQKLRMLAEFLGIRTVMTREDDGASKDYSKYSEHDDLVQRTELINSVPNGILISIHQNFYPTSQPSGAEILYAPGEKSRMLGENTQRNIVTFLQPGNRRLAGPASKSLYILTHISCPGILAECGFMSNITDLDQLTNDSFQTSLASVLLVSYLQFVSREVSV
ncbi:MAG: N-acetylmuramoyl-L-alanine amidase [Oscillospiraceae bacterium]|nr:N-acetylmuramoyl-L-alanine amidase [Oscillospiraceae bacterium]